MVFLKKVILKKISNAKFNVNPSLAVTVYSSPEPKAPSELIGWDSNRRQFVHLRVITFKHEYLRDKLADQNQISSGASLGWGVGCLMFLARSDQNSGFHGSGLLQ